MEIILPTIFLVILVWRILNWAWLKPKKLEKCLKQIGLRGTPYKLFFGDVKEIFRMLKDAKSKPMNLNHDIVRRVSPFIYEIIAEYGENSYIWTGPRPTLILMEPELIKEVFNKNFNFLKPPGNPSKLPAEGIATYEKEKWVKHRNLINPAFRLEQVKLMVPAFHESCCDMLSKWEKISPGEQSFELDVWPQLQTLSSDAISRTAFGSNYEEGRRIFELQTELVDHIMQNAQSHSYIWQWRFIPTKKNRRMKAIRNQVQSLVMEIINNRVKTVKSGEAKNEDLLDILLESNSREIEERGDKKFGLSLRDVIEECKLFYFAGQETVSVFLVWTLILLSMHPDWQDRAREEVRQVIGDEKKPHFEQFNHLKVITMIMNEVLRLYPPGTMLPRMTEKETKLGKLVLPAGVQMFLPAIFLHHDKKIWGEDANEFKPERFQEGILKATKGQLAFFPFGWGPRICPGQNFSMLESKMALVMMLQNYSFELSPSYSHAPATVVTLQPQHGAPLILRRL